MNLCQTIAATILLLMSFSSAHASDVLAVLKNLNTVKVTDAKTGAFKCSISVSHAVAVGCDGTTVAVLLSNGSLNTKGSLDCAASKISPTRQHHPWQNAVEDSCFAGSKQSATEQQRFSPGMNGICTSTASSR